MGIRLKERFAYQGVDIGAVTNLCNPLRRARHHLKCKSQRTPVAHHGLSLLKPLASWNGFSLQLWKAFRF